VDEEETFTSSQVSEITGISDQTIKNWERQKLIGPIKRDWKRWRIYTQKDIDKIIAIRDSKISKKKQKQKSRKYGKYHSW